MSARTSGSSKPKLARDHLMSRPSSFALSRLAHPGVEPDERYITLRWASIVSLGDQVVELPIVRLDTESISAWWLGGWSLPAGRFRAKRGSGSALKADPPRPNDI